MKRYDYVHGLVLKTTAEQERTLKKLRAIFPRKVQAKLRDLKIVVKSEGLTWTIEPDGRYTAQHPSGNTLVYNTNHEIIQDI